LYAGCHYFRAATWVHAGTDLGVGFKVLGAHLAAVADPVHLSSLIGLAVAGAALAGARFLSGTLACSIGLHAGWVFLLKGAKLFVEPKPGVGWLYGPNGIVGRPEVIVCFLAVVAVLALPRLRDGVVSRLASRRT